MDISVGESNLLGFLYPYFVSYFRLYDPTLKVEDMRVIPTYWLLAQIYSCPLGVYMYTKIGFRWTYVIFVTSFCVIQWLSSYITNFTVFSLIYGFSGGTSQGALLILPIYCCWRYFDKEHKAKVSGMVLPAYALIPLFTSYLALYSVNPANAKQTVQGDDGRMYFDSTVAMRVPTFLKLFGVVCAIIGYLGTFIILDPIEVHTEASPGRELQNLNQSDPKDAGLTSPLVKEQASDEKQKELTEQINNITHVSVSEALNLFKLNEFAWMYAVMVLGFLFPHMMNFSFKSIGLMFLKDDAYVTFIGSLGAAINALSRLFVGMLFHRYGYLVIGLTILTLEVITAFSYLYCAHFKSLYFVATTAFEITYGGQLGMYPLVSDQLFKKKGAMYYSYLYSSFTISLIVSLNTYSYLSKWFSLYTPFVVIAIASLCALPFVLKVGFREKDIRNGGDPVSGPEENQIK